MMNDKLNIEVDLTTQTLLLKKGDTVVGRYPVSTASNGPGEKKDSECTPRGRHIIAEKIGDGCEINTIFVGRRATGEIYRPGMRTQFPERDWIITRILWLKGTEPGFNLGGEVDSYNRYIYIHGTPDDVEIGKPGSRGCIRMRNNDMVELFEKVHVKTQVLITCS